MNYTNGLAILRRISPDRALEDWLDAAGELIAIDSGSGKDRKTVLHVDDDIPRDEAIAKQITGVPARGGGCTDGWSIVDQDNNIRGYFTSRIRAEEAVSRAKQVIVTEFELEEEAKPSRAKPESVAA